MKKTSVTTHLCVTEVLVLVVVVFLSCWVQAALNEAFLVSNGEGFRYNFCIGGADNSSNHITAAAGDRILSEL